MSRTGNRHHRRRSFYRCTTGGLARERVFRSRRL